jgi:hypothetical protein
MVVEANALFVLELELDSQTRDAVVATHLFNARQPKLKCCFVTAQHAVALGGRHRVTGLNAKLSPG